MNSIALPATPEQGYHLTTDLTDKAIEFIRDSKMLAPDKPFFMYFCPGATHAPHHAPKEWIGQVQGQVRHGLRGLPRARLRAAEDARHRSRRRRAVAAQPVCRREERRRQAVEPDRRRASVGLALATTRRGCSAGWPRCTRVPQPHRSRDRAAARLPGGDRPARQHDRRARLRQRRERARADPTARSTRTSSSTASPTRSRRTSSTSTSSARTTTYNHYPTGWAWAFNTPFKMWKRYELRRRRRRPADRLLAEGIAGDGRAPPPVPARHRHRADPATSASASSCPTSVKGYTQIPLEGVSFSSSFDDADAPTQKETQFYLDARHAGDLAQGLEGGLRPPDDRRAGATSRARPLGALRHRRRTRPRCHDLAAEHPEKLQELINLWFHEAGKYNGLPLLDRDAVEVLADPRGRRSRRRATGTSTTRTRPRCRSRPRSNIRNRRYSIAVEVDGRHARTPEACCSHTALASAAMRSTSRTASSSTSTTSSARTSRWSSRARRFRPASGPRRDLRP